MVNRRLLSALTSAVLLTPVIWSGLASAIEPSAGPRLRDRFADLAVSDELPAGLSPSEFERALRAGYFGTYVFYDSLSAAEREVVYQSYLRDPHIAAVRSATLERLK